MANNTGVPSPLTFNNNKTNNAQKHEIEIKYRTKNNNLDFRWCPYEKERRFKILFDL